MAAQTRNLHFEQGVSFVETYTWTTVGGGRQTFNGWTPKAQIRQHPSGRLLLDLAPYMTIVPDVTDTEGASGDGIQVSVPGDITRQINAPAQWDLRLVDATGGEHVRAVVLLRGDVTHTKAITNG